MKLKLGVVMDPISQINIHKDSTFAMLLEAERHGWSVFYMEQQDLFLRNNIAWGNMCSLSVKDDPASWFQLGEKQTKELHSLDIILMRKDPPFNMEYIYTTYILEQAEHAGVLVANKPQSLRDANEKMFTSWFPQCCPDTLVTRDKQLFTEFLQQHKDIIGKPLDGMGGQSIFRVQLNDANAPVIFETLSENGTRFFMLQQYLPAVTQGDKRILLINGKPIPYALARIPAPGATRANLAAGGKGIGVPLTERDYWICEQVGPTLRDKGLWFVGLDVIGDYLTEINVTSPTCIRELDKQFSLNISADLLDCLVSLR